MSLLQLVSCCSCRKPEVPCSDCDTNRCICEEQEYWEENKPQNDQDDSTGYKVERTEIPVTALHIEVSSMSTKPHRSNRTSDSKAWHYMNNKRWRATEVGPATLTERKELDNRLTDVWNGRINRLVLRARSWQNGGRYGDKLSRPRNTIMSLVLPSGQWGKAPVAVASTRCKRSVRVCQSRGFAVRK